MKNTSRTRWRLSKTGGTTDSKAGTAIRDPDRRAPTGETPEVVITVTETESTASTAKSRTIRRKNAERELKTISLAKTNKDEPIGLKCT
jgi:hypothetical protein